MNASLSSAGRRLLRRPRPLWLATLGVLLALPLVVARIGSDKLMLAPGALREQERSGTWRKLFDGDGVAAAWPVPVGRWR